MWREIACNFSLTIGKRIFFLAKFLFLTTINWLKGDSQVRHHFGFLRNFWYHTIVHQQKSQTTTDEKNTFLHLHDKTYLDRHRINRRVGGGGSERQQPGVLHSKRRSSSVSSISMFAGSAMGPSAARRAAISRSVFSLSCFFFSWIFFSLARVAIHQCWNFRIYTVNMVLKVFFPPHL